MTDRKLPLIPYFPIKVPPKSKGRKLIGSQLLKTKDVRRQQDLMNWYGRQTNRSFLNPTFDRIQSRTTKFIHQPGFRQALEIAEGEDAVVLVSDFYGLLARGGTTDSEFASFLSASNKYLSRIESIRDAGNPFAINTTNQNIPIREENGSSTTADMVMHPLIRLHAARSALEPMPTNKVTSAANCGNPNPKEAAAGNRRSADGFATYVQPHLEEIFGTDPPPKSLSVLAEALNEKGVWTRRGSHWTPTAVRRVLNRLKMDMP